MTDIKPRLGRDVYVALAAIGWADGQLDGDEADAIVRTALEEGLELDEISEIELATKERVALGEIDRRGLSKDDRLFVYAVACWLTSLDGLITEEEERALAELGRQLRIPDEPRKLAATCAREVAEMPEGDRPDRYDLLALRRIIGQRLEAAQRGRELGAKQ